MSKVKVPKGRPLLSSTRTSTVPVPVDNIPVHIAISYKEAYCGCPNKDEISVGLLMGVWMGAEPTCPSCLLLYMDDPSQVRTYDTWIDSFTNE